MSSNNNTISLEPGNEDTVQCLFFSNKLGSDLQAWKELCIKINNTIMSLSKDYIWQRDEFKVFSPLVECGDASGIPFHLQSITCFGDNIEDEWYIVHLALKISRLFNDLIIQITDNDGDFLLIEAADHLQSWANPDNTLNRVFVHNNHIHIIPPEVANLQDKLELMTAINIINDTPETTKASYDVEEAILHRIGNYPEKMLDNFHRTLVELPSNLATLLVLKPCLIAPIVEAYCNHDIIDSRCCKNIDFSNCVTIEVKFTKFLYATIMHSKLINSVKHLSRNEKKTILGLKLMCGYQMIMNKTSMDMLSSPNYHKFINSLKKNGYFKDNIEGSKEYNQLLTNAVEYYSITDCPMSLHLSHNINKLMSSNDFIKIKESLKDKHIVESEYTPDNEEWLNIDPDQLNNLLLSRYGKKSKLKQSDVISSQIVTNELSSFLKQTSDFEGVEPNREEEVENENVEFESDQFISCIEKMLNILSTGGTEISDSDEDDVDHYEDVESDDIHECDHELNDKLEENITDHTLDNKTVVENIIQSMKEERALTGPTSNLLWSIGIEKNELLDSDDDVD